MFEARLVQAGLFKKILDAIKDLVTDANFDCNQGGINLQAMDSSHVALVAMLLRKDGFDKYRADRNLPLGINLGSLSKIMKCAGNEDSFTIKCEDNPSVVSLMFENQKQDKISDFELKLMEIDSDILSIPTTDYSVTINMSATEFQRICRDLTILGDSVVITATKEGVKFSVQGDLGNGNITLRHSNAVDESEDAVSLDVKEPVALTFALRYLNYFTKATPLCTQVSLSMSKDVPLVVEYRIQDSGYLRFYLAPKVEDE